MIHVRKADRGTESHPDTGGIVLPTQRNRHVGLYEDNVWTQRGVDWDPCAQRGRELLNILPGHLPPRFGYTPKREATGQCLQDPVISGHLPFPLPFVVLPYSHIFRHQLTHLIEISDRNSWREADLAKCCLGLTTAKVAIPPRAAWKRPDMKHFLTTGK